MIEFLTIFNLIQLMLCQNQQKPLPSSSFGRIFNNSERNFNIGAGNFNINNGLEINVTPSNIRNFSACTNPVTYGFIQRAGTKKYYAIADIQMNWIDAENYCQSFGAHLPVADSANDINFFRWFVGGKFMIRSYELLKGFTNHGFSGYWLGFYKSIETNSWRLIDGSPLTYFDWDLTSHQPSGGPSKFIFDLYIISEKKHRGWHDWHMLGYNLVLCELKC